MQAEGGEQGRTKGQEGRKKEERKETREGGREGGKGGLEGEKSEFGRRQRGGTNRTLDVGEGGEEGSRMAPGFSVPADAGTIGPS